MLFQVGESVREGSRVLARPAVEYPSNGNGVQVVEFFASDFLRGDEPCVFEHAQGFHYTEPANGGKVRGESAERLSVAFEELVEQPPPTSVGERLEDLVHVGGL